MHTASGFPVVQTTAASFDKITQHKVKNFTPYNLHAIWIKAKPAILKFENPKDRMLYLMEFSSRIREFGIQEGYFNFQDLTEKQQSDLLARHIIENVLGISPDLESKIYNKGYDIIDRYFSEILSANEKRKVDTLKLLVDLSRSESTDDAIITLAGAGHDELIKFITENKSIIVGKVIKKSPKLQMLNKFIQARYAVYAKYTSKVPAFFKRMNIYIQFVDLALTPSNTASDHQMNKLAFLSTLKDVSDEIDATFYALNQQMSPNGKFIPSYSEMFEKGAKIPTIRPLRIM